jgi:hypothetical protein
MSSQILNNADDIRRLVQRHLDARQPNGFRLTILARAIRQDADWWYVPVVPDREDVRSHEYAEALASVEDVLREEGLNVLLVPGVTED